MAKIIKYKYKMIEKNYYLSSLVSLGVGLLGLFFGPWASLWSVLDFQSCWGFLDLETASILEVGTTVVSKFVVSSFRLDVGLISVCSSSEYVGFRFLLD